jgi:hypothetical protein
MWNYISVLKTAGWTQQDSSDGTTRAAAQVTSGASGAGGLANNSAWVRLQDPAGTREFTIQRSTASNLQWRVKYSQSAKFTGGSPSATQTPSATDETLIVGGGSDAVPSFVQWFTTDNTYRGQYCANNASPYGSYHVAYTPAGTVNGVFVMDPLIGTDSADTDLYAFIRLYQTTAAYTNLYSELATAGTTTGILGFLSSSYVAVAAAVVYNQQVGHVYFPDSGAGGVGTNPFSTKDEGFPLIYCRRSTLTAPTGWKGISTMVRWNGKVRTLGDRFTVSTANDWWSVNDIRLPWDGSSTPAF